MNRRSSLLLLSPAMTLLIGFVVLPLVLVVRVSLYESASGRGFYQPGTLTSDNFATVWSRDGLRIVQFTLIFALVVAVISVLLGYTLALFIRSLSPRGQLFALTLLLLPKTGGLLAALFGLQRLLPRGTIAAILTEVYFILPYTVLVLVMQLRSVDSRLVPAARGLGASAWQSFCRVTLPLSRPGVRVAFQLSLLWGLGAFLGPLFLGGPDQTTLAVELHRQAFDYNRWPRAAAEAVSLLLLALVILVSLSFSRRGGA